MHTTNMQSVLRCGQCNKPFDKESTLKRHGYYCRSRRVGSTTRPRSCISCASGKAACDKKRPECSRCIARAIECHYPVNTPKNTSFRSQDSDIQTEWGKTPPTLVADSPGVDSRQEASNSDEIILDDGLIMPDLEFANLEGDFLDWNDTESGLVDFLNPQTNDPYPTPGSSSLVRHSTSSPSMDQTVRVQQAFSSSRRSIPTAPTNAIRSLIQRPKMQTVAQRIANLILHTLKSYPLMMLRHNTLPPFIHPSLISSNAENSHMEPLTNCISLVHMISRDIQSSRKLFWKNVRLECERLCEEHLQLNKWELLASMLALSIYVLIRLDEGETDYNNLDFLLMKTFTAIAQQLSHSDSTCHTQCGLCNDGLEMSWKEWIFRESRRRLAVVYRVMNMLIYFEPVAMCNMPTDFILAPLPAKKQLWEANDEFLWKTESQREPGVQTTFALAADGELVKLDEGWLSCSDAWLPYKPLDTQSPSSNASWEEWCSGIDGFGGLVMLAASLIG